MDALTFLGTGCGWPTAERASSSLLLETNGRRYLLDAGEPCAQRLKGLECLSIPSTPCSSATDIPIIFQGCPC